MFVPGDGSVVSRLYRGTVLWHLACTGGQSPGLKQRIGRMKMDEKRDICCEVIRSADEDMKYRPAEDCGISWHLEKSLEDEIKTRYKVVFTNTGEKEFEGVIHFKIRCNANSPQFYMPGYMYNRNTADKPSSGRKSFPRIRKGADSMPESEFFMTRADRLALPVSLIYDKGHIVGISAMPHIKNATSGDFVQFCGFSCNINDNGYASVGYTLGYENAPWLFVTSTNVIERKPVSAENAFVLPAGKSFSLDIVIYDYLGEDERAVYAAIEDVYWQFHESPRNIPGMDSSKALSLLSSAIRDYAWIEDERCYTGFVYDKPEGYTYNKIPSVSWTNGLAVAVPMLMAADTLNDSKSRDQSITFINDTIENCYNFASGFLYESMENGRPTVKGWWYDGMHSGGHSSYLNGQAAYYLLKAYQTEKKLKGVEHRKWVDFAGKITARANDVMNTDYEYPFAMSETTGAGIEYDSMGSAWFLAAGAMYELVSGKRDYLERLLKSEAHYYDAFVKKVECYGAPLDTDKAVDSEGILSYIRAVRLLHEIVGEEYLLDHLRDALYYEFTFKLCYNTPVKVRPLSEIGWSSCGGSITSTANPHIHPMSSTVVDEMRYYLSLREDEYVRSRLDDTVGWGLQTFNSFEKEYGYGRVGWMSERFCFCEGLLTETYPNGEPASTWFALMPWASASIIEGLV